MNVFGKKLAALGIYNVRLKRNITLREDIRGLNQTLV
jgi:hypothetical protein